MDFPTIAPAGAIATPKATDPARLLHAAREFESFLIAQMLKTSREGTGEEASAAGAGAMESAEQQLAQALSASGGFGLAQMAVKSLAQTPVAR